MKHTSRTHPFGWVLAGQGVVGTGGGWETLVGREVVEILVVCRLPFHAHPRNKKILRYYVGEQGKANLVSIYVAHQCGRERENVTSFIS